MTNTTKSAGNTTILDHVEMFQDELKVYLKQTLKIVGVRLPLKGKSATYIAPCGTTVKVDRHWSGQFVITTVAPVAG